jgi:hypothetical protein
MLQLLKNNKLAVALGVVALLAVSSAAWNWYHPQVKTLTKTEYRTVTEEKKVREIKRVMVPGPERIVTIEKKVIVEKLGIDPIPDEGVEVIANADVEPSEGGTSVVVVMDTTTGESKVIAKEKPLSLFGFPSDVEAMLRYGLTTRGGQAAELAARYQFFRVGKFRLGAYGEVSSQPEAKAMLEVAYKF